METWGSAARMGWQGRYDASTGREPSPAHPDPTMVSLTKAEFDRLLHIEMTAQAAFEEMCAAPIHEKKFSNATEALDVALHSPALGG